MNDKSESTVSRASAGTRGLLTGGVKAAIALGVVVVLAGSAGGAYAYSDHAARQDAAARHAAAAQLASVRTHLELAEDSAVKLETELSTLGTAASGLADPKTVDSLTAA